MTLLFTVVLVLTLLFAFSNGFHDTSSAVTNAVATRTLTPAIALVVATLFNFVGALIGNGVVARLGNGVVDIEQARGQALPLLASAVFAALVWNLLTWWFAIPASSTHALVGGLLGAGLTLGAGVYPAGLVTTVLVPLVLSPLVGFGLSFAVATIVVRMLAHSAPAQVYRRFRTAQAFSTAALSVAHGVQDAQKSSAVIALAIWSAFPDPAGGSPYAVDWPVRVAVALALAGGTYCGGWRIVRTLGERLTRPDPVRGVVADAVSAGVLYFAAFALRAPISMTYVVTSSIAGAGSVARAGHGRGVDLKVLVPIVGTWLLSLPATALLGAAIGLLVVR